jgi:hypothetical protein
MIAVNGIYENGLVRLERKIKSEKTIKVIVTFLDDELERDSKQLKLNDFSFLEAREKSKKYKGSLADAIIEDRIAEL